MRDSGLNDALPSLRKYTSLSAARDEPPRKALIVENTPSVKSHYIDLVSKSIILKQPFLKTN